MCALRAMLHQHRVDRLKPLSRLDRINVIKRIKLGHNTSTGRLPECNPAGRVN